MKTPEQIRAQIHEMQRQCEHNQQELEKLHPDTIIARTTRVGIIHARREIDALLWVLEELPHQTQGDL